MTSFIVDSSVAVKWFFEEAGSEDALSLREKGSLIAPELLMVECTNAFWKKYVRDEISAEEAIFAARILERAEIEWVSMRALAEPSTELAIVLTHPVYDCTYLALAVERDEPFVTADQRLIERVRRSAHPKLVSLVIPLPRIAGML